MSTAKPASASWLGPWIALSVIWGFSFVFIKVCGDFLDPFQTTFGRLALGAAVLLIVLAAQRRRPVTDRRGIKHLAFIALLAQALPFTLFAFAEQRISSVAAGLVNSTMSLWTAVLAIALLPEERLSRNRALGVALGFAGILVLLGVWDASFQGNWVAYASCALATVGYAVATLWTRKHIAPMGYHPISAVATQLILATAMQAIAVAAFSTAPTQWPAVGVLSLVMLGAAGTGIALVLNFQIIERAGAVIASTVTYSIPIVATVAGAVLLREAVHWYEPVGAAIILFGIALVQGYLPRSPRHTLAVPGSVD